MPWNHYHVNISVNYSNEREQRFECYLLIDGNAWFEVERFERFLDELVSNSVHGSVRETKQRATV